MSTETKHIDSAVNRDMQEFEAKILDAATLASEQDQQTTKHIVDRSEDLTVETITPTIAALLFVELNKHNRDFSLAKAHTYADQMAKGYWRLVHQGLAFYPTRKLADGQHRIAAVFLSGTTQQFTVFRNFAEDAMEAIDTAKRRTAGDAFGIIGLVRKDDAKIAGSIVETVMKYEELRLTTRRFTPSIYEQKDWANAHLEALKQALEIVHKVVKDDPVLTKPEAGSIALGMLIGGYPFDETINFLDDVLQSVGHYPESPAVNLSSQYRKSKERDAAKGKLSKEEKLALAFKGAALCHNKLTTGGLRWKAGKEPLPAPVPPNALAQAAE
jgi:hypothetical protein